MTFKGMLKIMVNDYKKQHEEKMYSIVDELVKTRRELRQVKEQLHKLQMGVSPSSSEASDLSTPLISLFVRYNEVFNQLCDIRQTMTIKELLIKLRQITGIPLYKPIRLRLVSEDGLTTLFDLDKELNRTLESYKDDLKSRMILRIEDDHAIKEKRNHFQRSKSAVANSERRLSYETAV